MKNLRFIALATLVLVIVAVMPMYSQSGLRVNIPFQFNVGNEKLPAGDYLISSLSDSSMKIENIGERRGLAVLTNGVGGDNKAQGPKLVFNKYGDRLFLSQLWLYHSDVGRQLYVSAEEIEIARAVPQEQAIIMVRK